MSKIGLFYGPEGGSVEKAALLIAKKIGIHHANIHKVKETTPEMLNQYPFLIMGLSTLGKHNWASTHVNRDWDEFFPKLRQVNLQGKKLAIFGMGDHITYPNHFVDAIGDLAELTLQNGVELVGKCSTEGYEYNESRAEVNGEFLGLPLDEDFEPEKTEERINKWLNTIQTEFEL